jgi:hypothetical protein
MKMKCNCGYYYLKKWELDDIEIDKENIIKNNGKEDFIELIGTFEMKDICSYSSFHFYEPKKISLYVCPKCGTMQFPI